MVPFWVPIIIIKNLIFWVPKGTIILTTTHVPVLHTSSAAPGRVYASELWRSTLTPSTLAWIQLMSRIELQVPGIYLARPAAGMSRPGCWVRDGFFEDLQAVLAATNRTTKFCPSKA